MLWFPHLFGRGDEVGEEVSGRQQETKSAGDECDSQWYISHYFPGFFLFFPINVPVFLLD